MKRPSRENVERCMKGLRGEETEPVTETVLWADVCEAYLAALDVVEAARNIPSVYSDAKHHQLYLALRKFDEGE